MFPLTPSEAARLRAANEFHCPLQAVAAVPRPELSAATTEVSGCGKTAIYTCPYSRLEDERVCTRER
jgi:hypothetical protein